MKREGVVEKRRHALWVGAAVALLLSAHFSLAFLSARFKSQTFDEQFHLTRGVAAIRSGDFRINVEHPPLMNTLSAVPTLFMPSIRFPFENEHWEKGRGWELSKVFFWECGNDVDRILYYCRIPTMLVSVLLGFFVYLWSSRLYGRKGGLLSLFLFAFSPNVLAHARLATCDLGLTCVNFLTLFSFWDFLKRPSIPRLLRTGVLFSAALLVKYAALCLLVAFVVLLFLNRLFRKGRGACAEKCSFTGFGTRLKKRSLLFSAGVLLVLLFTAYLGIWTVYGFRTGSLDTFLSDAGRILWGPVSGAVAPNLKAGRSLLKSIPAPLISQYADTFTGGRIMNAEGHPAFLMGKYSGTGWWYYYIVVFLIKTPLPTLLLLGYALACWRRRPRGAAPFDEWSLMACSALFFLVGTIGKLQIGLRYILPLYPFLFVFLGRAAAMEHGRKTLVRVVAFLLCAWYLAGSLRIYPHYLAYFNEAIGGPKNGYRYLVDSNLDWGQDLKGLKAYMDRKGLRKVKLSYLGTAQPEYYGIDYDALPSAPSHLKKKPEGVIPTDGTIAISVTQLQGVYFEDKDVYAWLKKHNPIGRIGYSIHVFRVPGERKKPKDRREPRSSPVE